MHVTSVFRFLRVLLALFSMDLITLCQSAEPRLLCIEPDSSTGTSKAVMTDNRSLVHTAQVFPFDESGESIKGTAAYQAERIMLNLGRVLSAANSDPQSIVKLNVYLADSKALPQVQEILAHQFSAAHKPAATFVVSALPASNALVAMDAVAATSLKINDLNVKRFAELPGASLHGISSAALPSNGSMIYISGMADTNHLPEATQKTLEKLMSALGHLGVAKSDIVQLKAFFQPMSQVASVRDAIVNFFGGSAPPVVFVEWVSPAPNPPIEIELIAVSQPDSRTNKDSVMFLTPPGTTSTKVFSRVAQVNSGKLIYISGLYGMNARDSGAEVREIFHSLGSILKNTGSDFEHLVKATYYISDDLAGDKLNEVRPQFFNPQRPPAASKAKVKGVGVSNKTVSLDMIAVTN